MRRDRGRREALRRLLAAGALGLSPGLGRAQTEPPLLRVIPGSGEKLPAVGLGSWITFNVGNDPQARAVCTEVLRTFFAGGGRLVDSSPMYGSAQAVIGHGLAQLAAAPVFAADKVWTGADDGRGQIEDSRRHWGLPRFDLLQVHNLLNWEAHLPLLFEMKAQGRLRHVGVTTSHGRRHGDLERLMRTQPLDFVQLSYNIEDREAAQRLLPLAQERGIAVIVNRPFQQGALTQRLADRPLPGWAAELHCTSWAQCLLKFILAHPAVTCAIPATRQPAHARENLGAARGPLPDAALLKRMQADVLALL